MFETGPLKAFPLVVFLFSYTWQLMLVLCYSSGVPGACHGVQ